MHGLIHYKYTQHSGVQNDNLGKIFITKFWQPLNFPDKLTQNTLIFRALSGCGWYSQKSGVVAPCWEEIDIKTCNYFVHVGKYWKNFVISTSVTTNCYQQLQFLWYQSKRGVCNEFVRNCHREAHRGNYIYRLFLWSFNSNFYNLHVYVVPSV